MEQKRSDVKTLTKNTFFLYFRMILVMLVSIYTSRVKLQYLGIENVGIYNVVGSLVTMFTFLNGSMTGATQRFLTFAIGKKDSNQIKSVFSTSINMHLLIAGIIFLIGETVGLWIVNTQLVIPPGRIYAANIVYQLSLLTCMLSVISVPFNSTIVAYEKMGIYAYISIVNVLLSLIVIFTLPYIRVDILAAYATMLAGIQVLQQIFYMWYCKSKFKDIRYIKGWNKPLLKEMSGMIGWLTCGNFAFMLNNQGVNILLNIFFGPVINAARSIAIQVQGAVKQFVSGFMMAMQPQLVKAYASEDLPHMHRLLFLASKVSFFLMLLLSLPVLIEKHFILNLWLVEVPNYTEIFLFIILIQSLFEALSLPLIMSINATAQIKKFQIFESSFLLLAVPICYICLKINSSTPVIVYLVCFLIEALALFVRIFLTLPKIQLSILVYFKDVIFRVFPVAILCYIICFISSLFMEESWIRFITIGLLSCFVVLTFTYYIGLNSTERINVITNIKDFIHKKLNH